jgi:CheY-like chemotaxis protein
MKKTNLGLKTGLNYASCLRYIDLLKLLEWIKVTSDKEELVTITQSGKQVNAKLWLVQEKSAQSSHNVGKNTSLDTSLHKNAESSQLNESIEERDQTGKVYAIGRIMIVDDEPDVLLTYKSFLSSAGYLVEPFSDVQEAILQYIIKQSSFDLVILDIRMPDVNGLQLYQKFKAVNPHAKIMFVTSLDAARELVSVFPEIDPNLVLKKPVKKEPFLKTVKMVIGFAGN